MSKSLKKTLPILQLVSKIKNNKKRNEILSEISDDDAIFNAIKEIATNKIKGNIKLNKKQTKQIKKYDKVFKGICCSKTNNCPKKRKKFVSQSGGAFPILIPVVEEILSSLLNVSDN
jgi:hypothetical protein